MATGYIVWDSKGWTVIAGPFTNSTDANTAKARSSKKIDGHLTSKSSTNKSSQLTVETVTI